MLLAGLLAQSPSPDASRLLTASATKDLVADADRLLEELHSHMEAPMREALCPSAPAQFHDLFGEIAKEAIYYGAESAFSFQYRHLARDRYRSDFEWLLRNKGVSIRTMIEIADHITLLTTLQINQCMQELGRDTAPDAVRLTTAFTVHKGLIFEKFGARGERFLRCFSTPTSGSNLLFDGPTTYNEVNSRPIFDLGDAIYLLSSYKLYESIYESPYYWMMGDPDYKDIASEKRGTFLERAIASFARRVFGDHCVFQNAVIRARNTRILAEADVFIAYGEFLLVVQAKSKRLTIEARTGNAPKIEADFRAAVQSAYNQAVRFIDLLLEGADCEVAPGDIRSFKELVRAVPIVVLSDHFPSLTFLTNRLIEIRNNKNPVVLDIFFVDIMFRLLRDPVNVLYYLQQRMRSFDRIMADSEFELLGFHMAHKLYVSDECHFLMIDKELGVDLEEHFAGIQAGRAPQVTFRPLEERLNVPGITKLISALRAGPPDMAAAALELLDFSEDALQDMAANIAVIGEEVGLGKPFRAFSADTHYGGLSYMAVASLDDKMIHVASVIARKHKYRAKKDRWYVLVDKVGSSAVLDAVMTIREAWSEAGESEDFLRYGDVLTRSTQKPIKAGAVGETDC